MSDDAPADKPAFVKVALPTELYEHLLNEAISQGCSVADLIARRMGPLVIVRRDPPNDRGVRG